MGMKKIFLTLNFIKLSSFVLFMLYAAHPFLNGIGCDYHSQSESEQISAYTTCKLGFIDSVVKNNETKVTIHYKGIYGKSGDTIFFIVYDLKDLTGNKYIYQGVTEHFNRNAIFISKVIETQNNDWIILQSPYYTVQKAKRIGKLAFY